MQIMLYFLMLLDDFSEIFFSAMLVKWCYIDVCSFSIRHLECYHFNTKTTEYYFMIFFSIDLLVLDFNISKLV